jgi:hypothetical protein
VPKGAARLIVGAAEHDQRGSGSSVVTPALVL